MTFSGTGIDCPRGQRLGPGGPGAPLVPADPYGEEAATFMKDMVLQHEVEVEVEAMDKGGNFIGWMFLDGVNLSVSLVEAGLAKVHFTAERSNFYKTLCAAEAKAKEAKKNVGFFRVAIFCVVFALLCTIVSKCI